MPHVRTLINMRTQTAGEDVSLSKAGVYLSQSANQYKYQIFQFQYKTHTNKNLKNRKYIFFFCQEKQNT